MGGWLQCILKQHSSEVAEMFKFETSYVPGHPINAGPPVTAVTFTTWQQSSRDTQSSWRQCNMQSSLAHFRKSLYFSQFLFPKRISRRDFQQQVGFRKQCTNDLLFSLRIRHSACSGFGETLHNSISRHLRSLVLVFQGSVLGTSPALTRTKERRLQSLTRGRAACCPH